MSTDIYEQAHEVLERLFSKETKYISIKKEGPYRNSDLYTIKFYTKDYTMKNASYNVPKNQMEEYVEKYKILK